MGALMMKSLRNIQPKPLKSLSMNDCILFSPFVTMQSNNVFMATQKQAKNNLILTA